MAAASDNASVQYSVKELLALQNDKLDRIERKVDEAFLSINDRLGTIEHRLTVLEQSPNLEPRVRALEKINAAEIAEVKEGRRLRGVIVPAIFSIFTSVITWVILVYTNVTAHKP